MGGGCGSSDIGWQAQFCMRIPALSPAPSSSCHMVVLIRCSGMSVTLVKNSVYAFVAWSLRADVSRYVISSTENRSPFMGKIMAGIQINTQTQCTKHNINLFFFQINYLENY